MPTLIIIGSVSSEDIQITFNSIFGENVIDKIEVEYNKLFIHLLDLTNSILSLFISNLNHVKHIEYKKGLFCEVSLFSDFVPRVIDNSFDLLSIQLLDLSFRDFIIQNSIYDKYLYQKAEKIRFIHASFF